MRKVAVALVIAIAFGFGLVALQSAEAAFCTYRCICSVPYKCCGTACKPDPNGPLQCPQVYNC
jgi:hypothetical protein